ncbi:hypothetical protein, conserved [Eimeria tenella]|uniref:Uncharacterized protein n=1 Tax=Eimeria tenella TaxID=5802 RepID=U6KY94_EIMTE|nr:hypothetical protein, conserved [Eimeria tenella]CDJ43147.1 hypothetical protein, conserved [Eimeria tenella]|eukprot:XP_013233897.1 hypothetical protein, conserved [Eimeria tenella]
MQLRKSSWVRPFLRVELLQQQMQQTLSGQLAGAVIGGAAQSLLSAQAAAATRSTYGEMESDLALPLAQNTAELKAERLRLMQELSLLTAKTRQLFDSLHPDLANAPLLIVAKTEDDDKRNETNKLDAKGKKFELEFAAHAHTPPQESRTPWPGS